MKVKLLRHTSEPENIIAAAAKLCYNSSVSYEDVINNLSKDKASEFIKKLKSYHHYSPFEHATFTFYVEGVSRSLLAQLTRHRLFSFSVRSQRYVQENDFETTVPSKIFNNKKNKEIYDNTIDFINNSYKELINNGVRPEDARSILPNSCCTRLIATANVRELWHFFSERMCTHAQTEIRELAKQMHELCYEVSPALFEGMDMKCSQIGYCPEGNRSCGLKPTLDKLKEEAGN